jgi:hypothetical protein
MAVSKEAIKEAIFAKELLSQSLLNLKNPTRSSQSFSLYDKQTILGWLQNPVANEEALRKASEYIYLSSMQYQRLISYYSGILMWDYVISPVDFEEGKSKDRFKEQFYKAAHALEAMYIKDTFPDITATVLKEGVYYGARWGEGESSFYTKVNPSFCRISSVSDGVFLYAVDMSKITKDKLEYYPPVFEELYNEYKRTNQKLQTVPAEFALCIKADKSFLEYSLPPFAAVIPALYGIANSEGIQEVSDEIKNYKMITAQIPLTEEGKPKMDIELAKKYGKIIENAVGENVGVVVTPFELDSFEFDKSGGVTEVDRVARATANYWAAAGTSGLLRSVGNETAGVTKLSIKNDEAYMFKMMRQVERAINRYLRTSLSGTTKFKITFLPTTIFNRDECLAKYKEAASFGIGKSYYAACLGIPQSDMNGLVYIEGKEILGFDTLFSPLANTYNTKATKEEDGVAGRPLSDDDDLTESGTATRDNDTNANR